jgi:hypothetical protein
LTVLTSGTQIQELFFAEAMTVTAAEEKELRNNRESGAHK